MSSFVRNIFNTPEKAFLSIQETFEAIEFDASVAETHTSTAEVTSHPVEEGADITDHVRKLPEELSVNVIVSNYPPILLATINALPISGFGDPKQRAEDSFEFLNRIQVNSQLVSFHTTLRDYKNMAITSLTCERDKDTGNIANMNLSLREIVIATTENVAAPIPAAASSGRAKKTALGKKPATAPPSPVATTSRSLLGSIFSALGGG